MNSSNSMQQLLLLYNRLLGIYKSILKLSSSTNIATISDNKLSALNSSNLSQNFSNIDNEVVLDTGSNSLATNYESIINKSITYCKNVNDSICNTFEIYNKLENEPENLEDARKNKYYYGCLVLLLLNCKYLIDELKLHDQKELTLEDVDSIL